MTMLVRISNRLLTTTLMLVLSNTLTHASSLCERQENVALPDCVKETCCGKMGGINYCDSSAGRYVCNNGNYSSCYCTRNAIMDLQNIQGCCLWQGGILTTDPTGLVICNNGGVSEMCSLQSPPQPVASW